MDIVDAILKRTAELSQVQATLDREAEVWERRVLAASLFQNCDEKQMWSETPSIRRRVLSCSDRPRLIQVLARALVEYQYLTGLADKTPQAVQAAALGALEFLELVLSLNRHRPSRAPVSAPATPRRRGQQTIDETFQIQRQTLEAMHLDEYLPAPQRIKSQAPIYLLRSMEQAFTAYGPFHQRGNRTAVYHAMAILLLDLGMEKGDTTAVARRLWQRERRARRHATE